jgi:hypothetical protein
MNYLFVWAAQRPITSTLLLLSVVSMCAMLFLWRRHAEYLTSPKEDCPPEHLLKRRLFNGLKIFAIVLALISIAVKF